MAQATDLTRPPTPNAGPWPRADDDIDESADIGHAAAGVAARRQRSADRPRVRADGAVSAAAAVARPPGAAAPGAATPHDALDAAVRHLAAHPGRHGLHPALRLLQRWLGGSDHAWPASLQVRQSVSLAFPGAEIESLTIVGPDGDGPPRVEIVPAFGSLLGAHGALPALYTELLAERDDAAPRAFLDLFAQRLTALGYRAWRRNRLALQAGDRRRDRLHAMLLALAGVAPRTVDAADGPALAFHAAALRRRRSAEAVERVLSHQFATRVRLLPWAGGWHPLPQDGRARLGVGASALGHDTVVGDRVRQRDLRVRLEIGPLPRRGFDALLPGGSGAAALRRWLARMLGDSVEVDVVLVLRAADVAPARLGSSSAPRLGFDGFVLSAPATADRADAGYRLFAAP